MNLPISRKIADSETDIKMHHPLYDGHHSTSNQSFVQNYQECNNNAKNSCLYITNDYENQSKLIIYDTETRSEEKIALNIPNLLSWGACITQLPNGELFCYDTYPDSEITLIIDKEYSVKFLPSGPPCCYSSSIYFNRNVYCFGGQVFTSLSLSMRFDFDKNRWINITPMPRGDYLCHSIIFNRNILISGHEMTNILIYSIEIDSFSIIPYEFAYNKRKILVNAKKLYLIECDGFIYESEDEYHWEKISNSIIRNPHPAQVYALYNKGAIYISNSMNPRYYRFDLSTKIMNILQ